MDLVANAIMHHNVASLMEDLDSAPTRKLHPPLFRDSLHISYRNTKPYYVTILRLDKRMARPRVNNSQALQRPAAMEMRA